MVVSSGFSILLFVCLFVFVVFCFETGSNVVSDRPETPFVDLAGLPQTHRDPPVSAP